MQEFKVGDKVRVINVEHSFNGGMLHTMKRFIGDEFVVDRCKPEGKYTLKGSAWTWDIQDLTLIPEAVTQELKEGDTVKIVSLKHSFTTTMRPSYINVIGRVDVVQKLIGDCARLVASEGSWDIRDLELIPTFPETPLKENTMKQEYIIVREGSKPRVEPSSTLKHRPTVVHTELEDAKTEAKRLSQKYPGVKFAIFGTMEAYETVLPAPTRIALG